MTRYLGLGVFLLWSFASGAARAQTPFGGDDTGFIPPDSATLKTEAKVGKNLAKFQKCVLKCHAGRAAGKFPDDMTEDGCESICEQKYDLKAPSPLPPCLNTVALRNLWESLLDSFNSSIYCAGTTPFGGDDTGFIPPDPVTLKCEEKVGVNVAKLLKCQSKCHLNRAKGKFASDTDEEPCEMGCKTKYDAANTALAGCPLCLNASTLGDNMLSQGDNNNGQVYCAQ